MCRVHFNVRFENFIIKNNENLNSYIVISNKSVGQKYKNKQINKNPPKRHLINDFLGNHYGRDCRCLVLIKFINLIASDS